MSDLLTDAVGLGLIATWFCLEVAFGQTAPLFWFAVGAAAVMCI